MTSIGKQRMEPHMIVTASGDHFLIGTEFDSFADLLLEFGGTSALDSDKPDTPPLIQLYRIACEERRDELLNEGAADTDYLHLEASTWSLLLRLLDIRVPAEDGPDEVVPNAYSSDQAYVSYAIKKDKNLAEHISVKLWLEEWAPDFEMVEDRKQYRPFTQKLAMRGKPGAIAMDPDGPIRTGTSLAPDDLTFELAFHRALFSHLRRGELDQMAQLCRDIREPWKAASFAGASYFRDLLVNPEMRVTDEGMNDQDEEEETGGNVNRDLWKMTCLGVAREPAFDKYERAIYAAMAGNVENTIPVCKTWEDCVWAHYNGYIETVLDQHLSSVPHLVPFDQEITNEFPQENLKLPAEMFDWLSRSESAELRAAAQNPFRIIQAMLILDRVDPLLQSIHSQLALESQGNIPHLPTVLRFTAHFVLTLRSVSYPLSQQSRDSADFILSTYVDLLVAARKYELVPVYVGHLPAALQTEVYARFLDGLDEGEFSASDGGSSAAASSAADETRRKFVERARECGIDAQAACRRVVDLAFQRGGGLFNEPLPSRANCVFVSGIDEPLDASAARRVRSLAWLLIDPLLAADALRAGCALARRSLVFGRVSTARAVLRALPDKKQFLQRSWVKGAVREATLRERNDLDALEAMEPVTRRTSAGAFEYLFYSSLVEGFERLVQWNGLLGMRPLKGVVGGESDAIASFQYRDWVDSMKRGTDETADALRNCLEDMGNVALNDGGFFGDEDRLADILMIRDIYATELVLRLQHILFETRDYVPENLSKCVDLYKEFVDDGNKTFHKEFLQSGKIVFFMQKHQQAKSLLNQEST